jgi:hypothetical protein
MPVECKPYRACEIDKGVKFSPKNCQHAQFPPLGGVRLNVLWQGGVIRLINRFLHPPVGRESHSPTTIVNLPHRFRKYRQTFVPICIYGLHGKQVVVF